MSPAPGTGRSPSGPTEELPREPERPRANAEREQEVPRRYLAGAGALAAAAGLALSQATASALRVESGPVEGVAAAVRDFTPGPVAVFLVHLVGSADKPLLLGNTVAVILKICA